MVPGIDQLVKTENRPFVVLNRMDKLQNFIGLTAIISIMIIERPNLVQKSHQNSKGRSFKTRLNTHSLSSSRKKTRTDLTPTFPTQSIVVDAAQTVSWILRASFARKRTMIRTSFCCLFSLIDNRRRSNFQNHRFIVFIIRQINYSRKVCRNSKVFHLR